MANAGGLLADTFPFIRTQKRRSRKLTKNSFPILKMIMICAQRTFGRKNGRGWSMADGETKFNYNFITALSFYCPSSAPPPKWSVTSWGKITGNWGHFLGLQPFGVHLTFGLRPNSSFFVTAVTFQCLFLEDGDNFRPSPILKGREGQQQVEEAKVKIMTKMNEFRKGTNRNGKEADEAATGDERGRDERWESGRGSGEDGGERKRAMGWMKKEGGKSERRDEWTMDGWSRKGRTEDHFLGKGQWKASISPRDSKKSGGFAPINRTTRPMVAHFEQKLTAAEATAAASVWWSAAAAIINFLIKLFVHRKGTYRNQRGGGVGGAETIHIHKQPQFITVTANVTKPYRKILSKLTILPRIFL